MELRESYIYSRQKERRARKQKAKGQPERGSVLKQIEKNEENLDKLADSVAKRILEYMNTRFGPNGPAVDRYHDPLSPIEGPKQKKKKAVKMEASPLKAKTADGADKLIVEEFNTKADDDALADLEALIGDE